MHLLIGNICTVKGHRLNDFQFTPATSQNNIMVNLPSSRVRQCGSKFLPCNVPVKVTLGSLPDSSEPQFPRGVVIVTAFTVLDPYTWL